MVLCECLLVGMDWACPLRDVLCACPLSLLILRSGVLYRTLSHIWQRLYLPTFLFSVGLLTLMNIDSLIVLARSWSSLLMMLKLSGVVLCPFWVLCTWMGEGSCRCFLNLSHKVLEVSPMYSLLHARSPHWYQYIVPLFLSMGSLSLGSTNICFMVLFLLKWVWMPHLLQVFVMLYPSPCVYGITMWPLLCFSLLEFFPVVLPLGLLPSFSEVSPLRVTIFQTAVEEFPFHLVQGSCRILALSQGPPKVL